jgi:hypothetical protein
MGTLSSLVESVPTDFLWSIRDDEVGSTTGDGRGNTWTMDELEADIEQNGFKEPLLITVGMQDRRIRLERGNHRIVVAKRLGLERVPAVCIVKRTCELINGHRHRFRYHGFLNTESKVGKYSSPSSVFGKSVLGRQEMDKAFIASELEAVRKLLARERVADKDEMRDFANEILKQVRNWELESVSRDGFTLEGDFGYGSYDDPVVSASISVRNGKTSVELEAFNDDTDFEAWDSVTYRVEPSDMKLRKKLVDTVAKRLKRFGNNL